MHAGGVRPGRTVTIHALGKPSEKFSKLEPSQALHSKKNQRDFLLLLHRELAEKKKKTGCIVMKICTWGQVSSKRFPRELYTR